MARASREVNHEMAPKKNRQRYPLPVLSRSGPLAD
jgi:hypothetical protein